MSESGNGSVFAMVKGEDGNEAGFVHVEHCCLVSLVDAERSV